MDESFDCNGSLKKEWRMDGSNDADAGNEESGDAKA
jgi:hypothetical protein